MDDPSLARAAHLQALRGLTRINTISGVVHRLWRHIRTEAGEVVASGRPIRVLDVASGGGDIPIGLARRALLDGISIDIAGCDISRRAMAFARLRARSAGLSQSALSRDGARHRGAHRAGAPQADVRLTFFEHDALQSTLPSGYDVIISTLFLHHLDEVSGTALLGAMATATNRLVLVDDLVRHRWGLILAEAGVRLLSRSPVVHVDGPRSVRAALTATELQTMANHAGLTGHDLSFHFPARQLLRWRKPT